VFTDIDEELVVNLAAAAGIAIDNARLHARVGSLALVEDRERIARDLHDTVIQRLFAVGLSLQGAIRLSGDPVLTERMEAAVDELDATVREVRSAIFELHTARLPGRSTRQALLDLAAESSRALGFDPTVRFEGPVDAAVSEAVGEHLLAVAREALSNVAKHARASHATVVVTVADGRLHLVVEDDGRGPGPSDRGGRGLDNMSARARTLRGETNLGPRDGGGSLLRWSVPVD
jgi:signal transduction histidine kinase